MKYYAVKKGRNPGIYTSWDLCLKEVKGYKGAVYKSFKKKEDAEDFLEDKKIELDMDGEINEKLPCQIEILEKHVEIYMPKNN